jgi:hypothetical protein
MKDQVCMAYSTKCVVFILSMEYFVQYVYNPRSLLATASGDSAHVQVGPAN